MVGQVQCPHCGSFVAVRERGPFDVLWSVVGAAALLMRLLLSFARERRYPVDPGVYRCTRCGRTFSVFF